MSSLFVVSLFVIFRFYCFRYFSFDNMDIHAVLELINILWWSLTKFKFCNLHEKINIYLFFSSCFLVLLSSLQNLFESGNFLIRLVEFLQILSNKIFLWLTDHNSWWLAWGEWSSWWVENRCIWVELSISRWCTLLVSLDWNILNFISTHFMSRCHFRALRSIPVIKSSLSLLVSSKFIVSFLLVIWLVSFVVWLILKASLVIVVVHSIIVLPWIVSWLLLLHWLLKSIHASHIEGIILELLVKWIVHHELRILIEIDVTCSWRHVHCTLKCWNLLELVLVLTKVVVILNIISCSRWTWLWHWHSRLWSWFEFYSIEVHCLWLWDRWWWVGTLSRLKCPSFGVKKRCVCVHLSKFNND